MLLQAFTHTFVAPSVTVLWSSVEITQQVEAFGVFGIASSTAIEQVQTQELALVLGCPLENNRGSQHAVDWPVFKLVEAGVYLLGKKIQIHNCYTCKFANSWKLKSDQIETTKDQGCSDMRGLCSIFSLRANYKTFCKTGENKIA